MYSVHVKGPWAFYEHRHRQQERQIDSFKNEVRTRSSFAISRHVLECGIAPKA